jgi:uncharacterized protein (TIRG00374 family)
LKNQPPKELPSKDQPPGKPRSKRVAYLFILLGVAIGGYYLQRIYRETDINKTILLVTSIPILSLLLFLIPSCLSTLVDALAWRNLLPPAVKPSSYWKMVRLRTASEAVVCTVPMGSILADPLKMWLLKREFGMSLMSGAASVGLRTFLLADTQSILTLIVSLIGFSWLAVVSPEILSGNGYLSLLVLCAAGGAILLYSFVITAICGSSTIPKLQAKLSRIVYAPVQRWLKARESHFRELGSELRAFGGTRSYLLFTSAALYLFMWSLDGVETYLLLRILGLEVTFFHAFALEVVCSFLRSVAFFLPSGIGLQDSAYIGFLIALGQKQEAAAAFVVMKRARQLLWITLGYTLLLIHKRRDGEMFSTVLESA